MSYFYYQSKKVYYSETGTGKPVVFLHGDAASSRMFELILPLYEEKCKVILIDFLGNGRSDRVEEQPADLWQEEAKQTIALLEHLQYGKVSLAGTSGGAWAALNAALERPDLTECVVADSFSGRKLEDDFEESLINERSEARKDERARGFYEWCQGDDWERVVDLNTEALVRCAREKRPLFWKPLTKLEVPLLLMGSREDEMAGEHFQEEYEAIARETNARVHMFETGCHPAMLSNAEAASDVILEFISKADKTPPLYIRDR